MFDLIATILAWFYSLWPSYGVAIILLTLTVMVVVTPLTLKGTRSMLQMQLLQPELKRIQTEFRDDRAKMNEELMAFYQANGINPLGGCLPLLVQLPVFLVLFRVVRGLTRRATDIGAQAGWSSGRAATNGPFDETTLESKDLSFVPESLDTSSELYRSLEGSTEMVSWGIDLSRSASDALSSGLGSLPYLAMIVIVLITGIYQQRQIQGRNTGAQINPQQQAIMKVMPFLLPVFSYTMPAALVVYFIVSNLYRIGQQAYITRSLYGSEDSLGSRLAKDREKRNQQGKGAEDKKGRPTPKRDGARNTGRGGSAKAKTTPRSKKPGVATRTKSSKRASGAGRTGKAPTRHGGRTTAPGSTHHKKSKKKRK